MAAGTAAEIGIAGTAGAAISSLRRGAAACNDRTTPKLSKCARDRKRTVCRDGRCSDSESAKTISWNDLVPRMPAANVLGDDGAFR